MKKPLEGGCGGWLERGGSWSEDEPACGIDCDLHIAAVRRKRKAGDAGVLKHDQARGAGGTCVDVENDRLDGVAGHAAEGRIVRVEAPIIPDSLGGKVRRCRNPRSGRDIAQELVRRAI